MKRESLSLDRFFLFLASVFIFCRLVAVIKSLPNFSRIDLIFAMAYATLSTSQQKLADTKRKGKPYGYHSYAKDCR